MYAINSCTSAPQATSVQDISASAFSTKIYPNPSKGKFSIEMNESSENSTVEIYNSMGQRLYSQIINGSKMDVNIGLTAGVYVVRVVSNNGSKSLSNRLITTE